VEKYCRAGQATDGNMAHARCMLDNSGYRQTDRHLECAILLFHGHNGYANAVLCYIMRTLAVL